jgi:hypothetical protein
LLTSRPSVGTPAHSARPARDHRDLAVKNSHRRDLPARAKTRLPCACAAFVTTLDQRNGSGQARRPADHRQLHHPGHESIYLFSGLLEVECDGEEF